MRAAVLVALDSAAAASPPFRSAQFVGQIDNPWFPARAGVDLRGIGTVLEQTVKGGDERNTLVSVRLP